MLILNNFPIIGKWYGHGITDKSMADGIQKNYDNQNYNLVDFWNCQTVECAREN